MNRQELEMVQKFGCTSARLYPSIHKQVQTPAGTGILEQVFSERRLITLDRQRPQVRYKGKKPERVMSRFHPSEVEGAT